MEAIFAALFALFGLSESTQWTKETCPGQWTPEGCYISGPSTGYTVKEPLVVEPESVIINTVFDTVTVETHDTYYDTVTVTVTIREPDPIPVVSTCDQFDESNISPSCFAPCDGFGPYPREDFQSPNGYAVGCWGCYEGQWWKYGTCGSSFPFD